MKKWNTPEVAELNISQTENGIVPSDIEKLPFLPDLTILGIPEEPGRDKANTPS